MAMNAASTTWTASATGWSGRPADRKSGGRIVSKSLWVAILCGSSAAAAAEHPFMLWTAREAAAIRQQVATADLAAWQRRVRNNEALLRLIAGSGPQGAYAKAALDRGKTPAAEQQTPHERMRP
jgi:hypothetical protein